MCDGVAGVVSWQLPAEPGYRNLAINIIRSECSTRSALMRFRVIAACVIAASFSALETAMAETLPAFYGIAEEDFANPQILLAESSDDLFGDDGGDDDSSSADDLFGSDTDSSDPNVIGGIRFSGFWQNSLAYTYPDDSHYSKFLNIFKLRLNGRISEHITWQASGRLNYDPVFEFENFYPDEVEDDQKLDGWIDETFLDISVGNFEFRLGRQNIVWGEMVGLFFADVVSALDLRQFVLPDFEIIRVPQWSVRAEYFNGGFHGDVVFIPVVTTNNIGEVGAEYFPFPITNIGGIPVRFADENEPDGDFGEDFGFGVRGSYYKDGWDVSAFYYTAPDREAAFERTITLGGPVPDILFRAQHERIHQFGATIAKDLGDFVIKSEAIFTKDRLVSVVDVTDLDGLTETDELRYVIGANWSLDKHTFNAQFFQTWFTEPETSMFVDEIETGITLRASTTSWHKDVEPEVIFIRSLNRNEWLLQAKVDWRFRQNWRATLGADIAEGDETNFFGRYDDTDRVYYELRYSF
ncbi:MAG: DUF1302 family protein [Pseudomonadota bacterium]